MAYDSAFDSAWLKWGQARMHAQALEADVEATRGDADVDPVRAFRPQYYPKRHGFGVIVEDVAPVPVRWRLRLGDIANNYRAALDHLAWTLVGRGRVPPGSGKLTSEQEGSIYFPICHERSDFNAQIKVPLKAKSRLKLPGVRRTDAAKVRRRQPYMLSAKRRPKHAFALLATINNDDKHRAIQPVWVHPTVVKIQVTDAKDCIFPVQRIRRNAAKPLEIDTELAYLPCRKMGPHPQVEVELRVTAEPSIGDGLSAKEWANRCGIVLFQMLREFSEPPPEINDLGAELVSIEVAAGRHWQPPAL